VPIVEKMFRRKTQCDWSTEHNMATLLAERVLNHHL